MLTERKENSTIKKTASPSFSDDSRVKTLDFLNKDIFGSIYLAHKAKNKIVFSDSGYRTYRRPFWLPAPAYYFLTFGIALAVFFLVWGIIHEGEDMPWVLAGLSAGVTIVAAVILREVFLRQSRERFLLAQRRLDFNLRGAASPNSNKLTLEKNASLIKDIERKSEAAKVLGKLSEAHFDVFEVCNEYLQRTERELETIAVGSPRLAAIRRGREKVSDLHRHHLLNWAAIESKTLTQEARVRATIGEKVEAAQRALAVLDSALEYYPEDAQLRESAEAVHDFIASIKISHWIELAERAAFKGDYKRAVRNYRDALFYLGRENVRSEERDLIAERINLEIEKLREVSKKEKLSESNKTQESND